MQVRGGDVDVRRPRPVSAEDRIAAAGEESVAGP